VALVTDEGRRREEDALRPPGATERTHDGLWERAYLFEILRGLAITGGVFLRNMGTVGVMTGRKACAHLVLPVETHPDYAARNRGKHVLTPRARGRPQCIACNMCATVCPAKVIGDRGRSTPTTRPTEVPSRFEIDYSRCVFCGLCVELPRKTRSALANGQCPYLPSPTTMKLWLGKEELLTWQPQARRRQALPPGRGPPPPEHA